MSLQALGKKNSPPVIANGVEVKSLVVKGSAEKLPGFDPQRWVERAAEVAELRAAADTASGAAEASLEGDK
jgi:hypothetical protein